MSRRIYVFALAASATLIASQAYADRECFENSCRLPGVVDLPPPAEEQPAEADNAAPASSPSAAEVVEPMAQRRPALAIEVKTDANSKPVARQATRPAPAMAQPKLQPAAPVHRVDADRDGPAAAPARPVRDARVVRRTSEEPDRSYASYRGGNGGAVIVNVPAAGYANDGITTVRPYVLYTENHAPRMYVLAPNAKIIHIDDND